MKRQKISESASDPPEWWGQVIKWIRSEGGFVHASLRFSASRELCATHMIKKDTILLEIPSSQLVTVPHALSSGPSYCASVLESVEQRRKTQKGNSAMEDDCDIPAADIVLALYLATTDAERLPYHLTLPELCSFDSIPRRWNEQELEKLLKGSPLLGRIQAIKRGVKLAYDSARKCSSDPSNDFPSFERFSLFLAAVSSRAFSVEQAKGITGSIAMVPILDLCDHVRGQNAKKNVSYSYVHDHRGAFMQAKAAEDIEANATLRITYGAKGNGQLLVNYGFCIGLKDSLEPDGSSNNVYEFRPSPDEAIIGLRIGDRSYTYGSFVRALDYFVPNNLDDQTCSEQLKAESSKDPGIEVDNDDGEDDMEAFLNACEDEEDDSSDCDDDECFYGVSGDERTLVPTKNERAKAEMAGLASFRNSLLEKKNAYDVEGLDELLDPTLTKKKTREYYAALLVRSELETIDFFLAAIDQIESRLASLVRHDETDPKKVSAVSVSSSSKTVQFVEDLAGAFMKIRHGSLLL